jgi:hypothetical protein
LEYTDILEVFLGYIMCDDVSGTTRGMTNAIMVSKATLVSKAIVSV